MTFHNHPDWHGFLAAIRERPGDDLPRLVAADWLEEQGGEKTCPACNGYGTKPAQPMPVPEIEERLDEMTRRLVRRAILPPYKLEFTLPLCESCRGRGVISDGLVEYAEFIRLQCDQDGDSRRAMVLFGDNYRSWFPETVAAHAHLRRPGEISVGTAADDPTPLFVIRRGFIEEVRAPLAWLRGEVCDGCDEYNGVGQVPVDIHGYLGRMRPCPACHGAGRTPGHLRELVARWPITSVVVSDREPAEWHDAHFWERDGDGFDFRDGGHYLPPDLFDPMPVPVVTIPNDRDVKPCGPREAAVAALPDALLAEAREPVEARR